MESVSRFRRWRLIVGIAIVALLALSTAGIVLGAATPFQNVIVVNPPSSPVAVSLTGSNAISGSVNVGNLPATQPVSGTVNVGNSPTVQLDSTAVGHLANIDAATGGLSFDASGNLKVDVAAGALTPAVTDQSSFGSFCGYHACLVQAGQTWVVRTLSQPATVTAYAFNSSNDLSVQFTNTTNSMTFELFVAGGSQVAGSFDHPLSVHKFVVSCKSSSDCWAGYSVVGD